MSKRVLKIVDTPNNIAKGRIEIDAQLNKLYYRILNNIQRDNREFIIKASKDKPLTDEQKNILKKLDEMQVLTCEVTFEEIDEIIKRRNDKTLAEIENRIIALQTAIFEFTTGEKGSAEGESEVAVQLIGRREKTDRGYKFNLDAKLYKYLFYSLDVGYTPVNLATLFNLTGQYAQILYVLLRMWTNTKTEIEFTVKELRHHFRTGDKYPAYSNFKQRTIMQAIDEINATGSMEILKICEKKVGRSVDSVIFTVKDLEPRFVAFKDTEDSSAKEDYIEWIEGVKVANLRIVNMLDASYGNIKDGLAKKVFKEAFLRFIQKDKAGKTVIDVTGISFYMLLADELLDKHIADMDMRESTIESETENSSYTAGVIEQLKMI